VSLVLLACHDRVWRNDDAGGDELTTNGTPMVLVPADAVGLD
jgi:hypothetical protein